MCTVEVSENNDNYFTRTPRGVGAYFVPSYRTIVFDGETNSKDIFMQPVVTVNDHMLGAYL